MLSLMQRACVLCCPSQFLDCVWQFLVQYPQVFEFNPKMLLLIADALYSCRFGTFLFNCEQERAAERLDVATPSLWAHIRAQEPALRNPFYNPMLCDVLVPEISATTRNVRLWSDYFLRWSPRPSNPLSAVFELLPASGSVSTPTVVSDTVVRPQKRTFRPRFRENAFDQVPAFRPLAHAAWL